MSSADYSTNLTVGQTVIGGLSSANYGAGSGILVWSRPRHPHLSAACTPRQLI